MMSLDPDDLQFCSPFDEAAAHSGGAAIFLLDREGALRLAPNWSRDCWSRAPGPHASKWTWTLARDRDSGFVQLVLATSPTLLVTHPRFDLHAAADLQSALARLETYGTPAIAPEPW